MTNRIDKLFSKPLPKNITRKDIEAEDSLAMRARLLNVYLKEQWKKVEQIIGSEFPDDVALEDLVEELWEDIRVAREQICATYGIALDRDEQNN